MQESIHSSDQTSQLTFSEIKTKGNEVGKVEKPKVSPPPCVFRLVCKHSFVADEK